MNSDYFMLGQCHAYAHALVEKNKGWKYAVLYVRNCEDNSIIDVPHVYAYDPKEEWLYDVQGQHDPDGAMEAYDAGSEEGHIWIFDTWSDTFDTLKAWDYLEPDITSAQLALDMAV